MIKKFILGILCGIFATLFFVQYDPWVQQQIGIIFMRVYAKAFQCTVTGRVQSVNFLNPCIVLQDFCLSSSEDKNGTWSWKANQYKTGFSWPFFLINRAIDMWVGIEGLTATTDVHEGIPSITPHAQALMSVPDLPITILLKSTQIKNGSLTLTDKDLYGTLQWNMDSQRMNQQTRTHLYINSGNLTYKQKEYARALGGTITIQVKNNKNAPQTTMSIDTHVDLPQLGEYPTCFVTGKWNQDRGRFNVHSIDNALRINPLIITAHNNQLRFNTSASFPISYFYTLLTNNEMSGVQGECVLNTQGTFDLQGDCEGYVAFEDIKTPLLNETSIVTCSFRKQKSKVQGSINMKLGNNFLWHGAFWWKLKKACGSCQLYNNSTISTPHIPHWFIPPHNTTITINYDQPHNALHASYTAQATNKITNAPFQSSGTIYNDTNKKLHSDGFFGNNRYELTATPQQPYLHHAELYNQDDESLLKITYNEEDNLHHSSITMPFIRMLSTQFLNYELHAEGTINITSRMHNNIMHANAQLSDATIRLPQTYNFINGFKTSLVADIPNKRITLRKLSCTLHSGSLRSPRAVLWLDQSGFVHSMHVPLLIDHCLFTVKQDLFAMVSGYLLFAKQPHEITHLDGHIIFDRSQLKENLFSQQEQKKLFQSATSFRDMPDAPLNCNLLVETKDPIRVDTKFLQANAQLDLRIQDSITQPNLSGTISVPSGSIKFPYKPLQIAKGEITFFKDQLFNPLIELVAKNNIKNHNITLNVAGSLQNHAILLEATPPLTEEQIVNLLLTGAHEESLTAVIPALLMQNVSNFIFSSHKSNFFDSYIKPFMQQVNVQLKPEFNDQTGRGGLRGALEIVVNDRWRALIEKNFSLTEDTRFELEYILSDEVTFRVIRDERRDVGGEVEMKWKF